MNLADSHNATKFVEMLGKAEQAAKRSNRLNDWETKFVESLRENFDSREDAIDLGMTPWNPTVNQWNTLHGIVSKL